MHAMLKMSIAMVRLTYFYPFDSRCGRTFTPHYMFLVYKNEGLLSCCKVTAFILTNFKDSTLIHQKADIREQIKTEMEKPRKHYHD